MSENRNVTEGSPEEARAEQGAGEPTAQQPAAAPVPPAPGYGYQLPPQSGGSKVRFGRLIRSSAVHLAGAGLIGGLVGGGVVALFDHDGGRGGRPAFSRDAGGQGFGNGGGPGGGGGGGFGRQRTLPGQGQQSVPGQNGQQQTVPGQNGGQDGQTPQDGQTQQDDQPTTVVPG
ncbi:hypothetical protein [Actinocorallia longicatena]|uniref:Translation initiation factor IF-2 n=1 Tax=Actinocorallia longicatena TaxID=111803 RepID=A0ABP6QGJ4_9ACTN